MDFARKLWIFDTKQRPLVFLKTHFAKPKCTVYNDLHRCEFDLGKGVRRLESTESCLIQERILMHINFFLLRKTWNWTVIYAYILNSCPNYRGDMKLKCREGLHHIHMKQRVKLGTLCAGKVFAGRERCSTVLKNGGNSQCLTFLAFVSVRVAFPAGCVKNL